MRLIAPEYALDPQFLLYLLSALLTVGFGAGLFLFERFTLASRRFFLLTLILALWLVPLGFTHVAPSPEAEHLWLRITYFFLPLTLPGLYWLARSMTGPGAAAPVWGLWLAGGAFSLLDLASPVLVEELRSLFLMGGASGVGAVAVLYLLFEATAVALTVRHLLRSRRDALSGAEAQERLLVLAAFGVASLTWLDYVLASDPFRAGWLTPLALLAAAALVATTAIRYRMFAPGESFATDEVLRTMSDAVLVCDVGGRIRGSNRAAHRLLDRSEGRLLGRPIGSVVGRVEGGAWRPWEPSDEPRREELELRCASGATVLVNAASEPILFGGRPVGTVLVGRDDRERLEAERALRTSQRRYQSLFWNNPGAVYELDLEGRFVEANPAAEELLGVAVEWLVGVPFADVIAPGDLEEANRLFASVAQGKSREYEISVLHSSGEKRRIRGTGMPILGDNGEVTAVTGVAMDVTEETQVKQELEVQRRYFADLFESSPEAIVLVDASGDRVLRVNREFTRMFGYTAKEAVGRNLNELIVPEELRGEGRELNRSARDDGRMRTETQRRRKDGELVEVSVLARLLQIPGEPAQLYGVYRDITERKETERALRQREEELQHAQRLEAVGQLAGGIAHDFNNLLTVINGHARFALDQLDGSEALEEDLLEIERAGQRAAVLTQQLLAYSRRQMLQPQVLDPNEVLRQVESMMRRLIGEDICVETRLADAGLRVRADRGQLEQVLMNLVVNARDAMPEGGRLELSTDLLELAPDDERLDGWGVEPGEYVRLTVRDDGTGMESATLEQAFDPFFTTKEQGKGTGLGLATVFGIVKQSGGHVTLSSTPGQGTTCAVILPRARARAEAPATDPIPAPPQASGGTILVVEDEAAVRKLVVKVLERRGCRVVAAENGAEALERLADPDLAPDLIITDLVMPEMGGRELAEHSRASRPDLPILFMSGYDDDRVAGADFIADADFLGKPFTPAELAQRVDALLGAREAAESG